MISNSSQSPRSRQRASSTIRTNTRWSVFVGVQARKSCWRASAAEAGEAAAGRAVAAARASGGPRTASGCRRAARCGSDTSEAGGADAPGSPAAPPRRQGRPGPAAAPRPAPRAAPATPACRRRTPPWTTTLRSAWTPVSVPPATPASLPRSRKRVPSASPRTPSTRRACRRAAAVTLETPCRHRNRAASAALRPHRLNPMSTETRCLLQRVQPAMVGLIDGSLVDTRPHLLGRARSHQPVLYAFCIGGLATSPIGAGISMAFSEGLLRHGRVHRAGGKPVPMRGGDHRRFPAPSSARSRCRPPVPDLRHLRRGCSHHGTVVVAFELVALALLRARFFST